VGHLYTREASCLSYMDTLDKLGNLLNKLDLADAGSEERGAKVRHTEVKSGSARPCWLISNFAICRSISSSAFSCASPSGNSPEIFVKLISNLRKNLNSERESGSEPRNSFFERFKNSNEDTPERGGSGPRKLFSERFKCLR
jgi:hypothetical protein